MPLEKKQIKDMNDDKILYNYMLEFEQKVMIPYAIHRDSIRKMMISTRTPKLRNTDFGKFMGSTFEYDSVLTINYYGLTKVSTGFNLRLIEAENNGMYIKTFESPVVFFAAIKMKDITEFAPELVLKFSEYKEFLVALRNFPDKPQTRHCPIFS